MRRFRPLFQICAIVLVFAGCAKDDKDDKPGSACTTPGCTAPPPPREGMFVLTTSDGGASWQDRDRIYGCGLQPNVVTFMRPDTFLVLGVSTGARSTDHGATFSCLPHVGEAGFPGAASSISTGGDAGPAGFALVGSDWGGIYRTDDYGSSWAQVLGERVWRVNLREYPRGYALEHTTAATCPRPPGCTQILKTGDGGATWTEFVWLRNDWDVDSLSYYTDLDFFQSLILAVSPQGNLDRSVDAGGSWEKTPLQPNGYSLNLILFEDDGSAVNIFSTAGFIYHSTNGFSFSEVSLPNMRNSSGIRGAASNGRRVVAVGNGAVYASEDKGATWAELPLPPGYGATRYVDVAFNGNEGVIVGLP